MILICPLGVVSALVFAAATAAVQEPLPVPLAQR